MKSKVQNSKSKFPKKFLLGLGTWSLGLGAFAQQFTVTGYVEDSSNGEKLIGANVYEPSTMKGTITNTYGFYSLTLPAGVTKIVYRYLGYKTKEMELNLLLDVHVNIGLSPAIELKEVVITGNRIEEQSKMSAIEIPIQQIKSIPALFGEVDVLKALQLLPGVHSGGEGSSGLYVRGGGPDQNLVLLDGAPVYNAMHLFGFFSVFNADALRSIELIKGGFPARYGGRLSSVIDIYVKEGNMKEFAGEGSIGIVSSKLTVEGPIKKDTASFLVSGRRTYIDLLARPLIAYYSKGQGIGGYYFYDMNAKVNYKLSEKDRLYLSMYAGDDRFYFREDNSYTENGTVYESVNKFKLGWGNITSSFRWNHILNKKLFSNTMLTFSQFKFYTTAEMGTITKPPAGSESKEIFELNYNSGINDWSGKVDFDYVPVSDHLIKFGANGIYHTFHTGALQFKITSNNSAQDTAMGDKNLYASEFFTYLEDDYRVNARLKANIGVHASGFLVRNKFYYSVQPRFSARYFITEDWAAKASIATMTQYIHLLTNSNIGMPTDLWVPVTDKVKPQKSEQAAGGIARTLKWKEEDYEFSLEGYYKLMQNIIDWTGGAEFLLAPGDWEKQIESGKGWSYGSELFLQKKSGNTTGWLGYTLSWTWRQFAGTGINFGKKYPYKYDRRHDISVVVTHKLNEKIDVAGTWVYGTGNAITLPTARYMGIDENGYPVEIQYYKEKNGFRMRAYHRLDLGINFRKKLKWGGERSWNVSVYNVYNRRNPYFYYFSNDNSGNRVIKQVSLFPVIPSVSYSLRF